METVALNKLWRYIETLPLTSQNRQWLVDKLLSSSTPNKGKYYELLCDRLKTFRVLPEDWDDEGALPIFPSVIEHTQVLLDAASDSGLAHWNLFPAVNGTLTFQHDKLDAMLSIGKDDYSFVFASNGVIVKAVDHDSFSKEEVLKLMKMVEEQKYA